LLTAATASASKRAHWLLSSCDESAWFTITQPSISRPPSEDGLALSGDGAVQAELRRLRQESARLLMEREILKKAAAFFAREQP
jgi:hypothetical protein